MKYSIRAKKQFANNPAPIHPGSGAQQGSSLKRWVVLGLATSLVAGGTWALMEFVVWNKLPGELVGTWEVVLGPPEYNEAVFEFYRSGKLVAHMNDNGNLRTMNAEVRVEADKLFITTRRPSTGEEKTVVQHIRSLSATRLVVEDQQGSRMSMKRVD